MARNIFQSRRSWNLLRSTRDRHYVLYSTLTVKFWDMSSHSLQETRKPINLKVAVLSTDMLSHTVVAGTYDKVNLHSRDQGNTNPFLTCRK